MSELEDYSALLDNEPESEVEIVEEAVEEVAEDATVVAEDATEEAEAEEVETTTTEKEPWTLTAVLDEREKRQTWEKKAKELEERLKAFETPESDVSIFEDEKGFVEKQEQRTQAALRNNSLNMSEAFAESVFGEEKVALAKQWMQTEGIKSPYALDRFNAAKLPYHEIVKLYDDDTARRDPEAYKAKLREEVLKEIESKPKKSITPSLASKRSVGAANENANVDFEDLLKD